MDFAAKKINPFVWIINYVRESKEELRKVTWPSKQDTTRYSIVVMVLSILIAGFFGGLDWMLNLSLKSLIAFING